MVGARDISSGGSRTKRPVNEGSPATIKVTATDPDNPAAELRATPRLQGGAENGAWAFTTGPPTEEERKLFGL